MFVIDVCLSVRLSVHASQWSVAAADYLLVAVQVYSTACNVYLRYFLLNILLSPIEKVFDWICRSFLKCAYDE